MAEAHALREKCRHYAEAWGLAFERGGLPRTAGRIWGWLLTSDPPEQSAAELGDALRVTKGSVSTSTRLLERAGLIEKVGRPGARAAVHRVRPDAWETLMRDKHAATVQWRALAEEGLALLGGGSSARARRLADLRDFFAFMETEQDRLLERWRRRRDKKRG